MDVEEADERSDGSWTDGLAKKRYPKMQHGDDDPPSFSPPSSSLPPLSLEWMIDLFAHLIYVLLRRTKSSEPPPAPPHAASARPPLTVRRASAGASTPRARCARPSPREMREGGRDGAGFSVMSGINADTEDAEI